MPSPRASSSTPMAPVAARSMRRAVAVTAADRKALLGVGAWSGVGIADIERMLDAGASPSSARADGVTPLMKAAARGRLDIVDLLLSRKAKPDTVDRMGMTALHHACENGYDPVAVLLVSRGADARIHDRRGLDPIGTAADRDHIDCIRALVAAGVDIESPQGDGSTPLVHACRACRPAAAQVLLDGGAKLRIEGRDAGAVETASGLADPRGPLLGWCMAVDMERDPDAPTLPSFPPAPEGPIRDWLLDGIARYGDAPWAMRALSALGAS